MKKIPLPLKGSEQQSALPKRPPAEISKEVGQASADIRFIRKKEVQDALGVSNSTLYKLIKDGVVPPPIKPFGPAISIWISSEIRDLQVSRMRAAGRADLSI